MAEVTRVHGNAEGVVNFDVAPLVATGLTKRPTAFKIVDAGLLNAATERATGGVLEAIMRVLSTKATVVMYQLDVGQVSVLVEATGWTNDAELQAAIVAIGAVGTPAVDMAGAVVTSTAGFKLA